MYILIAAATPFELAPLSAYLKEHDFRIGEHHIHILVTGIGTMMTTYALTQSVKERKPDFMLQAGIGGSFPSNFSPSRVVIIKEEILGDLGVQEAALFNDIFDLALLDASAFPYINKKLINPLTENKQYYHDLPVASAVTVNEISTNKTRIELLQHNYKAEIESMEGAAFHYVALMEQIPFLQLRAVSNVVGERNKQNWKMKEAIEALNHTLIHLLPKL